jgi:Flp pilus assembly protein TadD
VSSELDHLLADCALAFYNLGNACQEEGRTAEAVEAYQKALELKPSYAEALNNLGNIVTAQGNFSAALGFYERALVVNPNDSTYWGNIGAVQFMLGEFERAIHTYHKALELNPHSAKVLSNLGNTVSALGRFAEAKEYYERAMALEPTQPIYATNLGSALFRMGEFEQSIEAHRRALHLQGDLPQIKLNLALALLASGQFEEGWPLYETRWQTDELAHAYRDFPQPLWRGETEKGRTLFIHFEQGLGDTLQFCRYASLAAAKGMRVILEVQEPLVRLLKTLEGVEVIGPVGDAPPTCDFHCSTMSLPLAFQTRLDTIPGHTPYLRANPQDVQVWKEKLAPLAPGKMRVGITWAGMSRRYAAEAAMTDRRRSMSPELLESLFKNNNICFFSLQKDGEKVADSFGLVDMMDECHDFADTAALIENLDLVISVDTSVAHLAGALGKPVWLMNRFDSCWRWSRDSESTPWYPSMRIFHSPAPGDWQSVVTRVANELHKQITI